MLHKSAGLHEFGTLDWKLALSLFMAWVIVFLCLIKGIKSTGKVCWVYVCKMKLLFLCVLIGSTVCSNLPVEVS